MRRRWLLIGGAAVGGVLVLTALLLVLSFGRIGAWVVRTRVLPRVALRLERDLEVGRIRVDTERVVLEDVVVSGPADEQDEPLARIPRVIVKYDLGRALRGDLVIDDVIVEGLRAAVVRGADGTDNASDLVARLRGRGPGGAAAGGGGRLGGLRPHAVQLRGAELVFRDEGSGLSVVAGRVGATVEPGGVIDVVVNDLAVDSGAGPSASVAALTWRAELARPRETSRIAVQGGRVSLWSGMSLTGIAGTVSPGETRERAAVTLSGGYGGVEGTLWRAHGWIAPGEETGEMVVSADRFTFDRLRPILEGSIVQDFDGTSVDAEVTLSVDGNGATFAGQMSLAGLNVYHPMLAEKPVRDLGFSGTAAGGYDRRTRRVHLDSLAVDFRGVRAEIDGFAMLAGGLDADTGERRRKLRAGGRLVIAPLPCQRMLAAMPVELTPHLQGFELSGEFKTDVRVDIDWADLQKTVLDGSVGIFGCRVVKAPPEVDARRLLSTFDHFVEIEQGRWMQLTVGPENPNFVPLVDVSPYLMKSLVTTEDSSFYTHRGFIVREFRSALIKNLEAGYFRYGASSITMQLVKNVLLYREKTLARKLQELFLTWYVETVVPKDRLMEIYVNVIEYGPALYGIGPAAMHYFGKHPRDLTPVEAAFFSSILPAPKRRYRQYCEGQLTKWSGNKIARILGLMHKRGRLTDEEYAAAAAAPLVFDRTAALPEAECKKLIARMLRNAPSVRSTPAGAPHQTEHEPEDLGNGADGDDGGADEPDDDE